MKSSLLTPTQMKRVEILTLDRHVKKLTWALGGLGLMHLTTAPHSPSTSELQERDRSDELADHREIIADINVLIDDLDIDPKATAPPSPYIPLEEVRERIEAIKTEAAGYIEERDRLESRMAELKQMLGEIEPIRNIGVPLRSLRELSFVHFASGVISERSLPQLENDVSSSGLVIPLDEQPDGRNCRSVIAVASRKSRFALDSALEQHNFKHSDLTDRYEGIPSEIAGKLTEELDTCSVKLRKTNLLLSGLGERHETELLSWRARAESEIEVIHAQSHFSRTHDTVLISGWVPGSRVTELQQTALEETDGVAVIEVTDPDKNETDIPTQIKHAPWLQPFSMLVKAYGYPGYREIEPTIMVAVSFLVMFGIMFGDIGHGLVLMLIGLTARKKLQDPGAKDFATIISYAGGAAMLFGVVYGSVFGIPEIEHKYALIRPMQDIMPFIAATVGFGVVLICIGLVINIINRLRSGDFYNGVLGRTGIVGTIFYTGALGLGIRAFIRGLSGEEMFETWQVVLLVIVPLLVIFLREPIYALITRRNKLYHEGIFGGVMEAGVEVMETISSFLSNTASFARVGAFALSHAGLCAAIFAMVDIVENIPGGPILTVLVLIFGNALIICMEGMVVGIQVVRLEYYEFFTKFFTGSGKAYQPFRISGTMTKEKQ